MTNTINVGIAGLGAIGMPVARWLDAGITGLHLAGVSLTKLAVLRGNAYGTCIQMTLTHHDAAFYH